MSGPIKTLFARTMAIRPNRRWSAAVIRAFVSSDLGWHYDKVWVSN